MTDLSIVIPSRNEQFITHTIADILEHAELDTEVIVILDGAWPIFPIPDYPNLIIIQHNETIGQRAACNEGIRISTAKYIMKTDAHCSFAQGFDRIMIEDMQPDWTMVPVMKNLHVFDWVCSNGHRRYQGPSGLCEECGKPTERDMIWEGKPSPNSTSYLFDSDMVFQYFGEFKKRPEGQGDLSETMSLQGSCWLMERERYWEIGGCDEGHGGWGQQGTEMACKSWLSGGKVICNQKTWYAHMFRTQGGDFSFPYPISKNDTNKAREYSQNLWLNNKWSKQVQPLSWLVEKFWPVPGWDVPPVGELPKKSIVFYTDNQLESLIGAAAQTRLLQSANGHDIISVSLEPMVLGKNYTLDTPKGYLTMFRQILKGIEESDGDYIFFAEHDCLYDKSHFEFIPPRDDVYYYNVNCWKVEIPSGRAVFHYAQQTSGLCASKDLLLSHYRERVRRVAADGYSRNMGFEPGTHGRSERVDDFKAESWMSEYPNLDLRHADNLTPSRYSKEEFRNQRYTEGWTLDSKVPGWGITEGRMVSKLAQIAGR